MQEESSADIDKTMEDKFKFKNKCRKRFGRKELTREEFIAAEEKDCKLTKKLRCLCVILPIGICIWMVVAEYLANGIENPVDLIFCIVCVLVVETAFMYFWWKIVSIGIDDRMNWIKKELENGD